MLIAYLVVASIVGLYFIVDFWQADGAPPGVGYVALMLLAAAAWPLLAVVFLMVAVISFVSSR